MGRIGTAFRAFFRVLVDGAVAERVAGVLDGRPAVPAGPAALARAPTVPPPPARAVAPAPSPSVVVKPPPTRSEALTLLAVLQREARLVDFLKEDIAGYPDADVGAAVRSIHRDAAAALDRIFALKPVRTEAEGAAVAVPAGYDAGRVRLVGNVTGSAPHTGTLAHAGWEAARAELPAWTGTDAAANVVAPAEVELK
jgi:hypothetical protein